ncbi:YgaP family membrane protein [Amaricoccus macauensis]
MVVTAAVGVVMLVVAAVRFCPIYALLGVRTCRS